METTLEVDSNELERLRKELDATTTEHAQAKKELDEANDAYQKADAAVNRVYVELLGVSYNLISCNLNVYRDSALLQT